MDRSSQARLERLEAELHGYKTNLIKESIRMGHNDLGDFYFGRGDLQVRAGLGWAGLGWAGLGWAGLGWAGLGWAGWCGVVWCGVV